MNLIIVLAGYLLWGSGFSTRGLARARQPPLQLLSRGAVRVQQRRAGKGHGAGEGGRGGIPHRVGTVLLSLNDAPSKGAALKSCIFHFWGKKPL